MYTNIGLDVSQIIVLFAYLGIDFLLYKLKLDKYSGRFKKEVNRKRNQLLK